MMPNVIFISALVCSQINGNFLASDWCVTDSLALPCSLGPDYWNILVLFSISGQLSLIFHAEQLLQHNCIQFFNKQDLLLAFGSMHTEN